MEIGTVETVKPIGKKRRRSSRLAGGRGNSDGSDRGNGGNNGGPSGPNDDVNTTRDKSRILTAFLLMVVTMTFGGLIGAYVVIATNGVAEWRPFDLPIQIWISTALILGSSATYHFAKRAFDLERQESAKKWLLITTILGASFISSQIVAWLELVQMGVYLRGNPYAGFFYILTAVHALHVTGGIIALGSVVLRSWNPTSFEPEIRRRQILAQVVGWYWHFMDALWIVLFTLLGFWR
jgi:cytochrome c oxidase subunit 3